MRYNKYRVAAKENRTSDGIVFASKAEMVRYNELIILQNAGQIQSLILQPKFLLQDAYKKNGKTIRAIYYIADFQYIENGKTIIEDVKGVKTKEYKLKKKMFEKLYPETITEIRR